MPIPERPLPAVRGARSRVRPDCRQEYECIHSYIQRPGDVAQVGGFVCPVGHKSRDMVFLEQHVVVLAEWEARIGILILGTDGKNHTAAAQIVGKGLEREKSLAHRNSPVQV